MKALAVLALIAGACFGYSQWQGGGSGGAGGGHGAGPFVEVPPCQGQDGVILVVAAENCPGAAARRADQLVAELVDQGLPARRASSVSFSSAGVSAQDLAALDAVMGGSLPIVFVGGRAKGDPSTREVAAEYRKAKR